MTDELRLSTYWHYDDLVMIQKAANVARARLGRETLRLGVFPGPRAIAQPAGKDRVTLFGIRSTSTIFWGVFWRGDRCHVYIMTTVSAERLASLARRLCNASGWICLPEYCGVVGWTCGRAYV